VSILFFTFSGIYPVLFPSCTDVITYRTGISNSTVKKIEEKLYELGYFDGIPDSYYGEDTKYAISKFQLARKLNVSGYADNETITELDIINNEPVYETLRKKKTSDSDKQDLLILARLINSEAPDADYQGKVAIGAVVMNRTKDPGFPDTICGVIYQPGAFNSAADGSINEDLKGDSEKCCLRMR
jgi:N-acetylmuramoyl-L-alanine amidase